MKWPHRWSFERRALFLLAWFSICLFVGLVLKDQGVFEIGVIGFILIGLAGGYYALQKWLVKKQHVRDALELIYRVCMSIISYVSIWTIFLVIEVSVWWVRGLCHVWFFQDGSHFIVCPGYK